MMRRSRLVRIGRPVRMRVIVAPAPSKRTTYATGAEDTLGHHATHYSKYSMMSGDCGVCKTAQLALDAGFLKENPAKPITSNTRYIPTHPEWAGYKVVLEGDSVALKTPDGLVSFCGVQKP